MCVCALRARLASFRIAFAEFEYFSFHIKQICVEFITVHVVFNYYGIHRYFIKMLPMLRLCYIYEYDGYYIHHFGVALWMHAYAHNTQTHPCNRISFFWRSAEGDQHNNVKNTDNTCCGQRATARTLGSWAITSTWIFTSRWRFGHVQRISIVNLMLFINTYGNDSHWERRIHKIKLMWECACISHSLCDPNRLLHVLCIRFSVYPINFFSAVRPKKQCCISAICIYA